MRRVFEGGEGVMSGGRSDRSIERLGERRPREHEKEEPVLEARERGGDSCAAIFGSRLNGVDARVECAGGRRR